MVKSKKTISKKETKTKSVTKVVDTAETFVKEHPVASVLGAMFLGYTIGRLMKKEDKK